MEERIQKPGTRVGTYEVLEHVATGGFSAIYTARDLEDDDGGGLPVALKMSRYEPRTMPHEERVYLNRRLEREFELVEPLWHRNIVRVLERQYHGEMVFYAMELLDGPTLGRWMAAERRSYLELMLVLRQLAGGLGFAHRQGIVHRDLKPSNVILVRPGRIPPGEKEYGHTPDPDERDLAPFFEKMSVQPVLIDFGIAQQLVLEPVTAPGCLVGTAEYLTPEYARQILDRKLGTPHRAEPRGDVFQMGVLLYSMLTGRLPTRTSPTALLELLEEIRRVVPRDPLTLNPEAPPAFARLAMECLSRVASKRPRDGAELARRISVALRKDAAVLGRLAPAYLGGGGTGVPDHPEGGTGDWVGGTGSARAPQPEPRSRQTDHVSVQEVEEEDDEELESGLTDREQLQEIARAVRSVRTAMAGVSFLLVLLLAAVAALGISRFRSARSAAPVARAGSPTAPVDESETSGVDTGPSSPLPGPVSAGAKAWKEPPPWQAAAPCGRDETELGGYCWLGTDLRPPCPDTMAEYEKRCFVAVRKKERRPSSPQDPGGNSGAPKPAAK